MFTSGSELCLFRVRRAPGDAKAMNARFHQSPDRQADGATALFDAVAHPVPVPGPADRACCCVARAVVRVVMPPAAGRPHETELLLCGHHYRVSRHALSAAHARVEELAVSPADAAAWFHDDHDRSVRASVDAP
jgi:hypothetical protein